ncbi:MAG TPA: ammonia-dependent NAD(+) synthetase [Bacillus bacterium]|nr:ammonia-dependent NAD(+) synthetase [Bacillus sp. (in: firmicutes)]
MRPLQKKIIEELKVLPVIDVEEEIRKSIDLMKNYFKKYSFFQTMVLGLSLGQDSTLAGKLAQMAVNELNEETGSANYKFIGVRLPYGEQKDQEDEKSVLQFIKPDVLHTVDIKPAVDSGVAALKKAGIEVSDFVKGNIKARERMIVQYSIGAMYYGVVLGTDHAAEAIVGFYTKFGDGAADLMPLYRLNKRQGKMILKHLNCPKALYEKVPTADLEDNKPLLPDEAAIGVTYEEIDDYLEGKEIAEKSAEKIEQWYVKSQHKRKGPITVFDEWWK